MRQASVILRTVGDSPLTELMELDEIYHWTERIAVLSSVFGEKKKRSVAPFILLGIMGLIGAGAIAAGLYLYFYL